MAKSLGHGFRETVQGGGTVSESARREVLSRLNHEKYEGEMKNLAVGSQNVKSKKAKKPKSKSTDGPTESAIGDD